MMNLTRFICIRFASAILVVFIASVLFADAAHAHGEPIVDAQVSVGNADLDTEETTDWVLGHCHGGPSCTGSLFLSDVTRSEAIVRLNRHRYFVVRSHLSGRLPVRDPPVPIALL